MKSFIFAFLLFTALIIGSVSAHAQSSLNMRDFQTLPVQHEGRIKPLDSVAKVLLKKLSASEKIPGYSADEWLALSLFDPASAAEIPVFKITSAPIQSALNLSDRRNNLYSLLEIQPYLYETRTAIIKILQTPDERRSEEDLAVLNLHDSAALYTDILRSFSSVLPLNAELPTELQKQYSEQTPTFLELKKEHKNLQDKLQLIIEEKGTDPSAYTEEEQKIAALAFTLSQFSQAGEQSTIFKVIPDYWEGQNQWLSPWQVITHNAGSPKAKQLIEQWKKIAATYRDKDPLAWQTQTRTLLESMQKNAPDEVNIARLNTEYWYRFIKPYSLIILCYCTAFFLSIAGSIYSHKMLSPLTLFFTSGGILLHLLSIIARSYILTRPPVATLYETLLFVSLICAATALFFSSYKKQTLLSDACIFTAAFLLLLAPSIAPQGDSLEVLVAVLNTNFWLATHVLCITVGYAFCVITAASAHLSLTYPSRAKTFNSYKLSLFALLFMVIGTILGGIWADQSWGRFWGWDPKENGALLICLWLIWAHHGRVCGKLGFAGFNITLAALNIIVALSWFGVNLLNVGLHSYGFTSGMAGGLTLFCALQLLLLGGLWRRYEITKQ